MNNPDPPRRLHRWRGRLAQLSGPARAGAQHWQAVFRDAVARRGVETVLAKHEKAHLLGPDFSVGSYLLRNPDVADAVTSAAEAVFHFLQFGHAEGRMARPDDWSPSFVRLVHGVVLPETLGAIEANAALRRSGLGPHQAVLTESDLWMVQGCHGPVFAQIFDDEFYAAAARSRGHPVPEPGRLAAIRHFGQIGLAKGIPPHPDHGFDAEFYRDALRLAGLEPPPPDRDGALFAHWARIGARAGAHANAGAWFFMRTQVQVPPAVLAGLDGFRAASADLPPGAGLAATLAHLADVPMPGIAALNVGEPTVATFLIDLARAKRQSGDAATAEWLLARVLDPSPGHPLASLELADLIAPKQRAATEIQLRLAVPPDGDAGANRLALAKRLLAAGRLKDALACCADLPPQLFGDAALSARRRALGAAIFEAIWSDLSHHIATVPIAEIQAMLADALALCTPPFTAPPRSAPIRRVAVVVGDAPYQCKLYRADQKIDQLQAAGCQAELFGLGPDVDRLLARLDLFDAVIFVRVPAFPPVIDLMAAAASQGLATFYDCDDLIFDPAVFPPPLSSYAGQITAADHAAIACGVPLFRHAMSLCCHGIASTAELAKAMRSVVRSGQVFVHPNALGHAHGHVTQTAPKCAQDKCAQDRLVIFYGSGTKAHKTIFSEVLEPALAQVLAARPGKIAIRLMGAFAPLRHLDAGSADVTVIPPVWDFESFCAELAGADINLSVLEPSLLTDAKSQIKWMEAALFAIPSVVSPTATHRAMIQDGVTGLFAADQAGFVAALLRLIDDVDLRARIGAAARDTVLSDYALPVMATRLCQMFSALRPAPPRPKTRLLIVNAFYPPQDIGGATRVVADNVADLIRRYGQDYEIDVLAALHGGKTPYEITCHARDGARVWTVSPGAGQDAMAMIDHRMADVMERLIARVRPDLVHLHCLQHLTASVIDPLRRHRVPYVVTLHDGWWVSPHQFILSPEGVPETYDFTAAAADRLPSRGRIAQRALQDAAAVLAVSEDFAELHRKAGLVRVEALENGVADQTRIARSVAAPGRVRLGHVGGMARHKGFTLLRAAIHAGRFENLDLLVVDHALAFGQTRHAIWNTTPVTFVARQPPAAMGALYGSLDVLVAPSIWPESYGLVAREALAAGLWVVASDRGAIGQDIVDGQNGFIVDVHDHRALLGCLAGIDADPDRFRKAPPHRARLRSAQAQVDDLHALYQRLLAGAPASKKEVGRVQIAEGDAGQKDGIAMSGVDLHAARHR
ncbi:MAG: glycosyltransferase [Pseudomonadota bacterium]